ncbi:Uma2 family endonuclease [Shouchella shacheensis]|uniref:Uma2 family endonuclease n=1 Tax=Shouchella shacheensis TaxID=1649580 RepID=UPI0007400E63|nr:Uma2 family endonuclease [Shouchella shacheensis]
MTHRKLDLEKNIIKENNLTYDDYAALDDQKRYELAGGKLELMSPSPSTIHQLVSAELNEAITHSCKPDYFIFCAPIDVIFSSKDVRQPDIALVDRKRVEILTNRGIEGSPDLVVEILSPSSLKRDKIDKLKSYADYSVPEYWIVDPSHGSLEQYVLRDKSYDIINIFQDDETVASPTIACISFTMKRVMDNIPSLR